jgi:catechol 2,3-dioxygenase-like lactoylglutathione lyase family enzyme
MAGKPYLRLRQICLVAQDLAQAEADLTAVLGLEVCHRDPNVGKYGLENFLLPIGTGFLEVVAPLKPGTETAAGRYLARRKGDGGYMVILDCEDVAPRRRHLEALGVRRVEDREHPGEATLMQLHPKDTRGALLEIDHHVGGRLDGPYKWAGPHWQEHVRTERVTHMATAEVQSEDPIALGEWWAKILQRPLARDAEGGPRIALDNASEVRFVAARDGRGEGLGGVGLRVKDKAAILASAKARRLTVAGDTVSICGTRFLLAGT